MCVLGVASSVLSGCIVIYANFSLDLEYFKEYALFFQIFLAIRVDSSNQQPAGWDTPPMRKIRGDNAVYFLVRLLM